MTTITQITTTTTLPTITVTALLASAVLKSGSINAPGCGR